MEFRGAVISGVQLSNGGELESFTATQCMRE
jgi:hypothetical protein